MTSAESARASRQPRYSFGAESTDLATPTWKSRWTFNRVNMVHFEPAMRGRRGYEFAAVEIFVTPQRRQPLRRVLTAYRRPPSSYSVTKRS